MQYILKRRKRKTICIKIAEDGQLIVLAPLQAPIERIEEIINSKQNWITKHSSAKKDDFVSKSNFSINYGEKLSICGKLYELKQSNYKTVRYDETNIYLPSSLNESEIKRYIIQVLKKITKEKCTEFAEQYKALTGFTYESIKVNSAKTRWGSCNSKNRLNFSFRLIMADEPLVRCVVLHELCHTKEHNHSKKFWFLMTLYMPNHLKMRAELKKYQRKISCENWD